MTNPCEIFASVLKNRRTELGMTQRELAEALGYSEKTVSKWESGGVIAPSIVLPELAAILKIDINSFFTKRGGEVYYLGVDGGGTKTDFALADAGGRIVSHVSLEGCNPNDVGFKNATDILSRGISAVCADIPYSKIFSFDEKAYANIRDAKTGYAVVYESREALGVVGAPYDVYLASDYFAVKDKYPARVLLKPSETALSKQIETDEGLLVVTDTLDKKTIEDFLISSGVHLYTENESVIYVNNNYLFLHTVKDGEQKINLPSGKKLYEVFEEKYYPYVFESSSGKSYLFKIY